MLPKHCKLYVYPNIIHKSNLYVIESTLYLRSAFFLDFTQREVVVPYRRFGTTYRPIFKGQKDLDFLNLGDGGR
jgi:hypothetical protein